MPHLKDRTYYELQYDRFTVDHFRMIANDQRVRYQELKKKKGITKDELDASISARNLLFYYQTGDRWHKKRETIDRWMALDRVFDEIQMLAPFRPVTCNQCGAEMEPTISTGEWDFDDPAKSRLQYFYHCPHEHLPGKLVYTDGKERVFEPSRCKRCNSTDLVDVRKKSPKALVTTCQSCGRVDRLDLSIKPPKKEQPDPHFERDRALWCISDEEGQKYLDAIRNLKELQNILGEHEDRKKNKQLYDAVSKIQKLTIFQVESLVRTALDKIGFADVRFEKADTSGQVILPFSFQEAKTDRSGRASELAARGQLNAVLDPTNWRLMTGSLSSRLGQLEGRLKGYDTEKDLLNLVRPASIRKTKLHADQVITPDGTVV